MNKKKTLKVLNDKIDQIIIKVTESGHWTQAQREQYERLTKLHLSIVK